MNNIIKDKQIFIKVHYKVKLLLLSEEENKPKDAEMSFYEWNSTSPSLSKLQIRLYKFCALNKY